MNENGKRKKSWILLISIILIGNVLYWGVQKEGYYIDELWSYGLSNGYYTPFLSQKEDYMNNWHQPSFYEDYLVVRPAEIFTYDSVYDNQGKDVHPPFYYMFLHTVCSLFPDRFSKWFGLLVNLPFYCGAVFLLYKISGLILGKTNNVSLIPPLLYGLSIGAVSTAIYIRMYMMLVFWTLLFVFLTLLLMKETEVCKKSVWLLMGIGLTVMTGVLTQYYFVIFAFFFSMGYAVLHMIVRQRNKAVSYLTAVGAGIIGAVLIFPASLDHILHGQQGKQAFVNVRNGVSLFFEHWEQYQDVVIGDLWGIGHTQPAVFLAACFILMLATICLTKKKDQKWQIFFGGGPKTGCIMLLIAVLGYFAVIVQISPEVSHRYQFLIYPFCVLLAVSAMVCLFRKLGKEWMIWGVTAGCLILLLRAYIMQPLPYIYKGYQEVLNELGTEYKNVPGIYVTAGDHLLINNCLFLAQQDMTFPLALEQLNELPEICKDINAEQLVLYVDVYYNELQTAQEVTELLAYCSYELLYDNTFTKIFLLSR